MLITGGDGVTQQLFAFDYWQWIYHELHQQSTSISDFLADSDAILTHVQHSYKLLDLNEHRIYRFSEISEAKQAVALQDQITRFGENLAGYRDQFCVLVYSYISAMVEDFFVALFEVHPAKMTKYISDSGSVDHVFKLIVNTNDRQELIRTFAVQAAKQASADGNKPTKYMANIVEAVKADVNNTEYSFLKDNLQKLKDHRNRLVHEPSIKTAHEEYSGQDENGDSWKGIRRTAPTNHIHPEEALEIYGRFIFYLNNLCVENDVPVFSDPPNVKRRYLSPEEGRKALADQWGFNLDDL